MECDQRTDPRRRHLERIRAQRVLRQQPRWNIFAISPAQLGWIFWKMAEHSRWQILITMAGRKLCLKNRNGPQLRVLKMSWQDLPPSIAFRLQGRKVTVMPLER